MAIGAGLERELIPWQGHTEGAKRFEEITKASLGLGIKYLTIWAGSYDNLTKRSKEEVMVLEKIYKDFANRLVKDNVIHKNKVRLRILGEWEELLNSSTVKTLYKAITTTQDYQDHNLTLLIGYNGDREMVAVIKRLCELKKEDKNLKVTTQLVKENLWTRELPEVDLVIRTGNEPHLSAGFMMWDVKYAQLHFSEKMWPEFKKDDLFKIIEECDTRKRRFGV